MVSFPQSFSTHGQMLPKVNPWYIFFNLDCLREQTKREEVHTHKFEIEMKEAYFIQSSTSTYFEDRGICVVTHACCEKNAKCLDN